MTGTYGAKHKRLPSCATRIIIFQRENFNYFIVCITQCTGSAPCFFKTFVFYCQLFAYPASRGFSFAWLLAFKKSFALLVCRVVGLFTGVNKAITRQTSHANDFVNAKSHAREKPLFARYWVTTEWTSNHFQSENLVVIINKSRKN